MKIVLFLSLLIQNVLLFIKSLLQSCLIFLKTSGSDHSVTIRVLLLHQCLILEKSLLKDASQTHTFVSVVLNLVVVLSRLAHFDVLLQFFDLSVLHLTFQFKFAILALQLLDQKRFKVVCFAASNRWLAPAVHIIDLLLKLASQIFNVLLLSLHIHIQLFSLGAQACILIACDVVLYL